jgi:hypothetical protein
MPYMTKGQTNQIFLLLLFLVFGGLLIGFILATNPAGENGINKSKQQLVLPLSKHSDEPNLR